MRPRREARVAATPTAGVANAAAPHMSRAHLQAAAVNNITLRAAIAAFVSAMRIEGYSQRTAVLYADALSKLEAFAAMRGIVRLVDLTPTLFRDFLTSLLERPANAPTNWKGGEGIAITARAATRALVRHYRREGVPVPDISSVRGIRLPERIQPRLTGPEFQALERALGSRLLRNKAPRFLVARDTAIVQVLVETGLRAAEMCALNVDDIDFEEGSIIVRHGKGAKDRALSIVDPDPTETDGGAVLRALSDYLSHRERVPGALLEPALWLSAKGNRLKTNDLRDALRSLCEEAGIRGNRPPHAFRRGWFSTSYQADPNALPVLQARMGWSSSAMVRVYTRGAEIDLARTRARPSIAKAWRAAADAREQPPRPKPAPVQRQESLHALLAFVEGDPALRRAFLQALGSANEGRVAS